MKLLIISHTPHYYVGHELVGWGPTVREIDHFAQHFEQVYHASPIHEGVCSAANIPYQQANVEHVPLRPSGGETLLSKLQILIVAPINSWIVVRTILKSDVFQVRLPTNMGVYLLPILSLIRIRKFWVKYAGNWNEEKPPWSYAFQRFWLRRNLQRSVVTINGKWINQKGHLLSFENPCLDEEDRSKGLELIKNKNFQPPFKISFVGRIEEAKGIWRLYHAISKIDRKLIESVVVIGEGPSLNELLAKTRDDSRWNIMGGVSRDGVMEVLMDTHFNILPTSASEGFPKVIAEGCNFGSIPIVSSVSSIGQYIKNNENGFVLATIDEEGIVKAFEQVSKMDADSLTRVAVEGHQVASSFTYSHYIERIFTEILMHERS